MTECPLLPWMRSKKLDQDGMADLLDAPQSAVGAYIRGERGFRLARFLKLEELTGIELKTLVSWTVEKKSTRAKAASPRRRRTARARHS